MATRTRELFERHAIPSGSAYWDLDAGSMVLGGLAFRLTVVGTAVGDSFLWAWANGAIPETAKTGLERVRQFGVENDLGLLVEECAPGGLVSNRCPTWVSSGADPQMHGDHARLTA